MLRYFQLIPTRIANIETWRTGRRSSVGNNLHTRIAKSFFRGAQIVDGETYVARTPSFVRPIFYGKVQLCRANLVPGAALASGSRLWHLFETKHGAVELFRRRFEFRRDGYVHMMKLSDHQSVVQVLGFLCVLA